ncbi:carbohydrate ABC transporter permease [Agrobacterium sp. NPDC090283]|uniref:carbohydrate ABC transporter permease n=1 Tax=Agrobacterium sp. NPDC090283 TaxID=3363920 RepID=UPI00383B1058
MAVITAVDTVSPVASSGLKRSVREELSAWLFLLPSVVPFLIFTLIPAFATFVLSFYRWDFISTPQFVGLDNWIDLFSGGAAGRSVLVTLLLCAISVPASMATGLALAFALDRIPFGKLLFRSIFFMPIVTSMVAISFVFGNMFATETGLINYVIGLAGLPPVAWLTYPTQAIFAVSIMMIWSMSGLCMLIYLAGLQQIDQSLIEAARLDGASRWQLFLYVVRPLLARSTLFLAITQTVSALQTFEAVYVLTDGGPGTSTTTIGMYIYKSTFRRFEVGSGASASMALFVLMLIVTVIQLRAQRRMQDV